MPRLFSYPAHKSASILIVCLWTLVILSILGMGLTGLVLQEIKFASSYLRMTCSLPVARAALRLVFYERPKDTTPTYDTMQELTQGNDVVLCEGTSYKYCFADKKDGADTDGVIDEGALVNLNTATVDILKRLPGIDSDLADKLANSGLRPYRSVNEVFLAEGMTAERFKDYVTIYGVGKININTASKPVLIALGLDEELADIILRFRKEHKIEEPPDSPVTAAGYGFSSVAKILEDLRSFASLGLRQEEDLLAAFPLLDVKSEYLRFNVIPKVIGREGIRYSVTIHPATKKILSWAEY